MIEIQNVRKSFGDLEVLKGIDLTVQRGEVVTVIGGSGSGKSTLLTCINGLEPIDSGRITIDGTEVHAKSTNLNKLRRKVGIVFQQWNAFPHLTVLENVTLAPRKVLGMAKAEAEAIAEKQLRHVGLGDKLTTYPSRLSGGQQPRMAIARALAMFARDVSNRVAFFHQGIMAEIGAPDQLFNDPQHPETQKFLANVR